MERTPHEAPATDRPGAPGDHGRFLVSVSHHGRYAVFSLIGELDLDSAGTLREKLEAELRRDQDPGVAHLVLDCSALDFCDSTGLNVLLGIRLTALALGGELRLVAPQPHVTRMLEITGVDSLIPIHRSLQDALLSA